MKKFALAAVAALAVASPAYAQNLSVEVQGGYDAPKVDGGFGTIGGVSYGATLAYEMPIDESIFLGAEVSIDDSTADECAGSRTVADPLVCASFGRDLGAGLRFGADLGKSSSVYGVVGYTNLRVTALGDDGATAISGSTNVEGIKLGAGYRQWFGKRAYGKVEYRYSNYEGGLERHQGLVGVGYQF